MRYMLDTNTCIYIIKHHPPKVKKRLQKIPVGNVGVSSIVVAELCYAVAQSQKRTHNQAALDDFLEYLLVLDWPADAALPYGEARTYLKKKGAPIGAMDLLIAGGESGAGSGVKNTVYFDNVRVPRSNVVGEENRGWYVAVTLLDFERSGIDYSANGRRLLDETLRYAGETKSNGKPLSQIPWVRNALADRFIECEVARLMAYNVAYMQGQGQVPNKEASMSKVFGSEAVQHVTKTGMEILGMYGILSRDEKWAPLKGRMQENWMSAFSGTIAAGTSEVQRNIIASRGLGLPRG